MAIDLTNAIVCHSVRKVNPSYNGPILNASRTSDSVQLDYSIDNRTDFVNQPEYSSFIGTSPSVDGWVFTWYNQVGSVHSTAQGGVLKVVKQGVTALVDGLPALQCDGGFLQATSNIMPTGANPWTVVVRHKMMIPENQGGRNPLLSWGTALGTAVIISHGSRAFPNCSIGTSAVTSTKFADNYSRTDVITYDGTNTTFYSNGFFQGTFTQTINAGSGPLRIFQSPSGQGDTAPAGYIQELIIYNEAISDAKRIAIEQNIAAAYKVPQIILLEQGDSITNWQLGVTKRTDGYGFKLLDTLFPSGNGVYFNDAVIGNTTTQIDTRASSGTGIDNIAYGPNYKKICVTYSGTNDLSSVSPSTTYNRILTMVMNRKRTKRYDYIVVCTINPTGSAANGLNALAVNDLLRAGMATNGSLRLAGCDALADAQNVWTDLNYNTLPLGADVTSNAIRPLNDPNIANNATLFPADQIHPGTIVHQNMIGVALVRAVQTLPLR